MKVKLRRVLAPMSVSKDCWIYLNPRSIEVCVRFKSEVKINKIKLSDIEKFMKK